MKWEPTQTQIEAAAMADTENPALSKKHPRDFRHSVEQMAVFLHNKLVNKRCDCEAVSHCVRCNIVSLCRILCEKVVPQGWETPDYDKDHNAVQRLIDGLNKAEYQRFWNKMIYLYSGMALRTTASQKFQAVCLVKGWE